MDFEEITEDIYPHPGEWILYVPDNAFVLCGAYMGDKIKVLHKGRVIEDKVENFNGMQLLYVLWPNHLMFCAPFALLVQPDMTFGAMVEEILKPATASHPDAANADFLAAQWLLNDEPFTPDADASLIDNGIDHKSMLTVTTPGLNGLAGAGF